MKTFMINHYYITAGHWLLTYINVFLLTCYATRFEVHINACNTMVTKANHSIVIVH